MVITNDREEYVRWVCRYCFLAPIQRAFEPGCELQQIPVLWGPRGTGKSSVVEYLMPPYGRKEWYSSDFRLLADSKSMIEMTEGKVVIEWPELRGIARLDPEEIKAYISGHTDRARKAYAKRAEDVPRRGVLIGTTNEPTLKADPALMRRIIVLHVDKGADVGRIRDYMDTHRAQLFAEAYACYEKGERAHLDYHLEDGLDLNNSGAVHRNWNVIESIADAIQDMGATEFTKDEFCEAIGVFESSNRYLTDPLSDRERRRLRDQWWLKNGSRYTRTVADLGFKFCESERPRVFKLIDSERFEAITRDLTLSRSKVDPALIQPVNPQNPGLQGIQGSFKAPEKNRRIRCQRPTRNLHVI